MNNYRALEPAPTGSLLCGFVQRTWFESDGCGWLGEWVKRPGYEFADGELEAMGLGASAALHRSISSATSGVRSGTVVGSIEWRHPTQLWALTSKMSADDGGAIMPTTSPTSSGMGYITVRWKSPKRSNCTKTALHQQSVTEAELV